MVAQTIRKNKALKQDRLSTIFSPPVKQVVIFQLFLTGLPTLDARDQVFQGMDRGAEGVSLHHERS